MTTIDDLTMSFMNNINVDRLIEAKRNGNLISYYAEIAGRILGMSPPREDTQTHGRSATETLSNPSYIRFPPPHTRRSLFSDEVTINEEIVERRGDVVKVSRI